MNFRKYEVLLNDKVLASGMDFDIATIFIKSLFLEYFDSCLIVSIRQQEDT